MILARSTVSMFLRTHHKSSVCFPALFMGSSLFFALGASYLSRVAKNILRLRELVTITSKQ